VNRLHVLAHLVLQLIHVARQIALRRQVWRHGLQHPFRCQPTAFDFESLTGLVEILAGVTKLGTERENHNARHVQDAPAP
jgi:hypothetical protein